MMRFIRIFFSSIILLTLTTPLYSFEWVDASLGGGLAVQKNIRKYDLKSGHQNDVIIEPIPLAFLRFGPWFINKDGAGMGLAHFHNFKLLALLTYRGDAYKSYGYEHRRKSFFAGGSLSLYWLQFKYYQDVEGRSHGKIYKGYIAPGYGNEQKGFYLSPRLYFEHWDQKYTDYYFGVRTFEENLSLDRPAYIAKDTDNYGYEFRSYYTTGNTKWILSVGQKFYGGAVKESPTVKETHSWSTVLGLLYRFY